MLVCDAILDFPAGRKGYLIHGTSGAAQWALRCLPGRPQTVTSPEEVASAAAGTIIIPPEFAQLALEYVEMPKSDRTYVFLFEETETTKPLDFGLMAVKEKFSKLKLPQIDCTNPQTPKAKQSVVQFLMATIRVSEDTARLISRRAEWDLGKIFRMVYKWTRLVRTSTLTTTQTTNLVHTLLPLDPSTALVEEVLASRFHRITPTMVAEADPTAVIKELATKLDTLRIVSRVLGEAESPSIYRDTGLSQAELKYYLPLAKRLKKRKISEWNRELIWAYPRRDQPGALAALVAVMGR